MITTTCLIGVLVGALTSARPARPAVADDAVADDAVADDAVADDAVAAAAVSTLAASPAAVTRLTRLTSFMFMGLPSPSVRELSGCRETAVNYLKASVSMDAVIGHGRNKR